MQDGNDGLFYVCDMYPIDIFVGVTGYGHFMYYAENGEKMLARIVNREEVKMYWSLEFDEHLYLVHGGAS